MTAAVLAAVYTWVADRLLGAGLHWLPATLLTVIVFAASSNHFHVRPHIATIALLGVTFALLSDFEAGRIPLGRLFWLVPLFIIWTNWHAGVLGGLATLALASIGWWLMGLSWQEYPPCTAPPGRRAGIPGPRLWTYGARDSVRT